MTTKAYQRLNIVEIYNISKSLIKPRLNVDRQIAINLVQVMSLAFLI